jgi:hypothetical protein
MADMKASAFDIGLGNRYTKLKNDRITVINTSEPHADRGFRNDLCGLQEGAKT